MLDFRAMKEGMAQMTVIAETFKRILEEMEKQTATLRSIEANTRKGE